MYIKKYILCCTILMLLTGAWARAQDTYTDRAQKYIDKYGALAIEEQKRSGVPASITLGQGILETEAGASELMTKANNHFGIKCKSDWKGDKILHTDDAPNECFKSYKCAEESYKDHSDYLKRNPRYNPLFNIKQTDYKGWAVCLRKCGYATNPQYAQQLIKIIENFKLQDYTYTALDSSLVSNQKVIMESDSEEVADDDTIVAVPKPVAIKPSAPPPSDSSKVTTVNGMKAFYAHKGELLQSYALKYKIRYPTLLQLNDLPDGPLPFNTYVYLEKKQTLGPRPTHEVKEGETLLMIAQAEGMQLKRLMAMNMLNPNEEPVTGAILYLQSATAIKPEVKVNETVAHTGNAIVTGADTVAKMDDDFIAIKRPDPVAKPVVKTPVQTIDTPIVAKSAPVVVNVPKPEPKIDTPKPHTATPAHVIVVKNEVDPPVYKQTIVSAYAPEKQGIPEEKKDTAMTEEQFTQLKAELDKVVYADDSKLIAKMEGKPQTEVKPTQPQGPRIEVYYTVKWGDTAFSIAKKYNTTVDELLKLNNIDAAGVKVGKSLRVK